MPPSLPKKVQYNTLLATILLATSPTLAANYSASVLYSYTSPAGLLPGSLPSASNEVVAAGASVGWGVQTSGLHRQHAVLWTPSGTPIDLHPAGFTETQAFGTDGFSQVGGVPNNGHGFISHALLWSGSAASAIDLHPASATASTAYAVSGSQQVGWAFPSAAGGNSHAFAWSGSAASAVDLHPISMVSSVAYGTNGARQVGEGDNHALLWNGSAASAVDLHPASGFSRTFAYGVSPTQQVGGGYNNNTNIFNALLWNGSAASLINLNPAGYTDTFALSTNGLIQVGYGLTPSTSGNQALLWTGSAASVFNLGSLLPSGFSSSTANTIDASGTIYGTASDTTGNVFAVKWTPIPEPGSLSLLALILPSLLHRQLRRPAKRYRPR